jgi:hypothetical protein
VLLRNCSLNRLMTSAIVLLMAASLFANYFINTRFLFVLRLDTYVKQQRQCNQPEKSEFHHC